MFDMSENRVGQGVKGRTNLDEGIISEVAEKAISNEGYDCVDWGHVENA